MANGNNPQIVWLCRDLVTESEDTFSVTEAPQSRRPQWFLFGYLFCDMFRATRDHPEISAFRRVAVPPNRELLPLPRRLPCDYQNRAEPQFGLKAFRDVTTPLVASLAGFGDSLSEKAKRRSISFYENATRACSRGRGNTFVDEVDAYLYPVIDRAARDRTSTQRGGARSTSVRPGDPRATHPTARGRDRVHRSPRAICAGASFRHRPQERGTPSRSSSLLVQLMNTGATVSVFGLELGAVPLRTRTGRLAGTFR